MARTVRLSTVVRNQISTWESYNHGDRPTPSQLTQQLLIDGGYSSTLHAVRDGAISPSDIIVKTDETGSITILSIRPRRKIKIEIDAYLMAHGREPRGVNEWVFSLRRASNPVGCNVTSGYIKSIGHPARVKVVTGSTDVCGGRDLPGLYFVTMHNLSYAEAVKEISAIVRILESNGAVYHVAVFPFI